MKKTQSDLTSFVNFTGKDIPIISNGIYCIIKAGPDTIILSEQQSYSVIETEPIHIVTSQTQCVCPDLAKLVEPEKIILDRRSALICRKYEVRTNVYSVIKKKDFVKMASEKKILYFTSLERIC